MDPGSRLGPYELVGRIGAGGMGEVYRAIDTRLSRTVAVKVLPPDLAGDASRRARFEREARAVASLSHPRICALYDIGREGETDYLVMEFLEGETLDRRLARSAVPIDQVLRVGIEVAGALDHAHRRGIVHRDVKPSNIMLTPAGSKLLDFGVAAWRRVDVLGLGDVTSATETATLSGDRSLVGTVQYMSPEQIEGKPSDVRSDVFALGTVLFEMVCGRKAFDGENHARLIAAILSSDPPSISSLQPAAPAALEHVVKRCLAKDPEERWQTALDVQRELEWVAVQRGTNEPGQVTRGRQVAWKTVAVASLASGAALAWLAFAAGDREPPAAKPVRFVERPADNVKFSTSGAFMALSPDGRYLAYIGSTVDGTSLLWVRSLTESIGARALPGTDGASQPFWSPDSQMLAFGAHGKLKKISIGGGLPEVLCDAPSLFAGAWNRDGVILFSPKFNLPLFRVSASGGDAVPATALDASRGEQAHGWPQFLPDGRHFLYSILSVNPESDGVAVGRLGDLKPVRPVLLNLRSQAVYTPPGYLLFQRNGTLLAQHFDAGTLALTGDQTVVAESIDNNTLTGRGAFSVSMDGALAYRAAVASELVWFDRTGRALAVLGSEGRYSEPAISPDGKRIAITRVDTASGTPDLWLVDSTTGAASQFTFDPASDTSPVWSPDGQRLAFSSDRRGNFNIFSKAVNGEGGDVLMFALAGEAKLCAWSPDGKRVLFQTMKGSTGGWKLWEWLLAGGEPRVLVGTDFSDGGGRLSNDGRWLAYEVDGPERSRIHVRPAAASSPDWTVSKAGGTEPRWRGDGRELYFLRADRRMMAVSMADSPGDQPGEPVALFETPAFSKNGAVAPGRQYDVTADGQRFLILRPRIDGEITLVLNWPATMRHER